MIDVTTNEPIRVRTDRAGGPYMVIPLDQLDAVRKLLDANKVYYWTTTNAVSINNKPFVIGVYFGHRGDAQAVQRLLDGTKRPIA